MATVQENENFSKVILVGWPLDQAIEWIEQNLTPGDVFDKDAIFNWVCDNAKPQDVFSDEDLQIWANNNPT